MDLYNAMNCEKGKYMYWVKKVQEAAIGEETTLMINVFFVILREWQTSRVFSEEGSMYSLL